MDIRENVMLKDFAWWKIGGPAEFFCLPKTVEQVQEAVEFAKTRGLMITVLGGGTNVLISDQGIKGLVICMKQLSATKIVEDEAVIRVEALAGTPKSELTKIFLKRKLAPALFLCGLPGDVGGGVVMNAGVAERITPREFVEITAWVDVLDLNKNHVRRLKQNEIQWHYRHSEGWQPGIIVRAEIVWPNTPDETIPRKVTEATKVRRGKQPLELPSCGSTFKNPPKIGVSPGGTPPDSAGALIEKAGLKGYTVGGAQVSPKHANFIVNIGGASASDVDSIIRHVRSEVKRQFQVDLETEVRYLGLW